MYKQGDFLKYIKTKYAEGGSTVDAGNLTNNMSNQGNQTGSKMGGMAAPIAASIGNYMDVFGRPDKQGPYGVKSVNKGKTVGQSALKGAAQGAAAGSAFGPWGCVCAGTKVITNKGEFKNIEDLIQSDGIVGWDGEKMVKQEIVAFQPPAKKECIEIETQLGHTLRCSLDHPILSNGKYVDAENLKVNDNVSVIFEILLLSSSHLINWDYTDTIDKIKSIKSIGQQDIYNLEAGGSHTYIANGIITHNTLIGGAVGAIKGTVLGKIKADKMYKEQQKELKKLNQQDTTNKLAASGQMYAQFKKGGKTNWMKDAVKKPGSFTAFCKSKGYDGVTEQCVSEGKRSKNPLTKKRANLAATFRSINKKK